jgi:hypothetical protein
MQTTLLLQKMLEEEANSLLKGREERQPTNKRMIVFGWSINFFFWSKIF